MKTVQIIPFKDLMTRLSDYPHIRHADKLREVYDFAVKSHDGQTRRNGEPYINHPIRVAMLMYWFGDTYVMGALLHDVVEDTDVTFEQVEKLTNPSVMSLVRGLTKRKGFKSSMVALNEECRLYPESGVNCIYIKLADRYDNLQDGINSMPLKVRQRYVRENKKLLELCRKYEITFTVKGLEILIRGVST